MQLLIFLNEKIKRKKCSHCKLGFLSLKFKNCLSIQDARTGARSSLHTTCIYSREECLCIEFVKACDLLSSDPSIYIQLPYLVLIKMSRSISSFTWVKPSTPGYCTSVASFFDTPLFAWITYHLKNPVGIQPCWKCDMGLIPYYVHSFPDQTFHIFRGPKIPRPANFTQFRKGDRRTFGLYNW